MTLRKQPDLTRFGFQPNGTYVPGRAEIKQRCAEIQSRWSVAERTKRKAWAQPVHVTLQQFADKDV